MKVLDSGMQVQKLLRPFTPLESKWLSLLTSCGTMRLFDHVVTSGRGDDLLVINFSQTCDLSDRGPVACELVRVNSVWDIIFTQELSQEGLCGVGIPVPLKQDVEHEAVLVHRPPAVKRVQPRCSDQDEPVSDAVDARTHLVQMPLGTPPGFPVAKLFGEEGRELDTPFAQRLVEEWRPHAVKRDQPRCSDQDGRPFTTMLTSMPRW